MSIKKKTVWTFAIIAGVLLLLFLANFYVKHKLGQELNDRFEASAYENLSVNIYLNNFSIENVEMKEDRFALAAKKISAGGLSYYKYLFKNKLEIDELEFFSPAVSLFPADTAAKRLKDQKQVVINSISVKDGIFRKKENDSASASFYAHIPTAVVKNVKSGMKLSEINSYELQLDSVYLKMNPQHYIDVDELSGRNGRVEISGFRILPLFPRQEFTRRISYEKDWITLEVKKILLDDLSMETRRDTLFFKDPHLTIREAFLNIYRNKTLEDYPGVKPLYSKLLREAPVLLDLNKVIVENSEILYEEMSNGEGGPAMVRFAGIHGEIDDLHNIKGRSSQPKITANADFMRGTPVSMEWTFDVFDPLDRFEISGSFGNMEGEALDPFLVPSLDARARGTLNEAYFNFYGNNDFLKGDFRMDYDKFKIELLKEESGEKKGFLSSLANLLVDNKKEPDEESGQEVRVERTKNRSFWNFVWKGLREGLIDAVGQL